MSFACPECGEKLKICSTKSESKLLKKRYYVCTNYQCSVKTMCSFEELVEVPAVYKDDGAALMHPVAAN